MPEELKPKDVARYRLRPMMASAVVVLGAATALAACGDSSDDAANGSAKTKAAATTTAPAATTAAPAATAAQPAATDPNAPPAVGTKAKAWSDAGTVRLAPVWLGTPGTLSVKPNGNVDTSVKYYRYEHWYPKGTKVTVTAHNGKASRFAEWAGACSGKDPVCAITMDGFKRTIAGFSFDKKRAKGLSSKDPAMKPGTGGA
ncbi:hypothetical protein [Baekduia sp. Peel2402]|uniref:hypothetical protein n=1 Tax=Baekduia sp. Peel2402 TaxID=3458296 RepID=UPI00403E677D